MEIVHDISKQLGFALKDKQVEVIEAILSNRDVFGCLPTGYGKSLCYAILPKVFDKLRGRTNESIVLIISPHVALMMDQQEKFSNMGLTTLLINTVISKLLNVESIN